MATPTEATPALSSPELQKKLDHLKASATQQYSLRNYSAAADFYSEAAQVQDLVNGEMSPENSDLLYQYGRCLYHVGVSKSDVLGGKVAGNHSEEPKRKKRKTAVAESSAAGAAKGEGLVAEALKNGKGMVTIGEDEAMDSEKPEAKVGSDKPFFQITGDENWTDSEEDDEKDADDAGWNEDQDDEEEDDDDFAIAYEILDVARVLLGRKLESLQSNSSGNGDSKSEGEEKGEGEAKPSASSSPEARQIRERLADTHDLQAEIKLENEQFADAVTDARAALDYKLQLYPQESGMVAEAHYKLAIALDFAALPTAPAEGQGEGEQTEGNTDPTTTKDDKANASSSSAEEPQVNEELRSLAATEMAKAIASCQLRIAKESQAGGNNTPASAAQIADIKSMVAEMKTRLAELRRPAQALTAATGLLGMGEAGGAPPDGADPLRGVLGAMLGASKAEQARTIQEATSSANDLSGLVRKRKAKVAAAAGEGDEVGEGEGKGKKAKVEEA